MNRLMMVYAGIFLWVCVAQAHEGHVHPPGENEEISTSGTVTITRQAVENLQLKTQPATVQPIEQTITLIGQIEAIPSRTAIVASRISGRVVALHVNEGQAVAKGQRLVEIESRQPGEPPPRVTYSSPIDGLVIDRHVLVGDPVEPDRHLMDIADLREVYAEGMVFEGQVALVQVGQPARVRVESFPDKVETGNVELTGGKLDPESRTLKLWVRVPNQDLMLKPNMRATLSIVVGGTETAIAAPKTSILGELGQYFVFVQSDSDPLTFERRPITVGVSNDQYTEIIEGVLPGDRVVTSGNYQLQYLPTNSKVKQEETTNAQPPH